MKEFVFVCLFVRMLDSVQFLKFFFWSLIPPGAGCLILHKLRRRKERNGCSKLLVYFAYSSWPLWFRNFRTTNAAAQHTRKTRRLQSQILFAIVQEPFLLNGSKQTVNFISQEFFHRPFFTL
ncbi:MAG TPA: hypothetical protein VEC37_11545, partial [Bacillota bacterium]|nr:hypothetical protein [Bacillota bacterium]